jgi:hypothetical protein
MIRMNIKIDQILPLIVPLCIFVSMAFSKYHLKVMLTDIWYIWVEVDILLVAPRGVVRYDC